MKHHESNILTHWPPLEAALAVVLYFPSPTMFVGLISLSNHPEQKQKKQTNKKQGV